MLFCILISFPTASKQRRSLCFREWLGKKTKWGLLVETQIGYHVSLYFPLIESGTNPPSVFEFLVFVLAGRALKLGQQCTERKRSPLEKSHWDIKCGPGTWNMLPLASESSAFRWKHRAVKNNTSYVLLKRKWHAGSNRDPLSVFKVYLYMHAWIQFYRWTLWCWRKRNRGTYRILNGRVCCINV